MIEALTITNTIACALALIIIHQNRKISFLLSQIYKDIDTPKTQTK